MTRRYTALRHVPPHIRDAWRSHNTVCGFGYAALMHLPPGAERTEVEDAVVKFPDRFEKLEDAMEAGDMAAAYRDIADLLLLAAMLGASLQVLPEIAAKVKARGVKVARDGNSTKAAERRKALVPFVLSACESLGRKAATTEQCVADIRPYVLANLPPNAEKPSAYLIRETLKSICLQEKIGRL